MNSQHYIYIYTHTHTHTHARKHIHINDSALHMYVLGRWMRKIFLTKFYVGWRNSKQTDE